MKKIGELSIRFSRLNRNRQLLIGGSGFVILLSVCILSFVIFTRVTQPASPITAAPQKTNSAALVTQTPAVTTTAIPFSTATSFGPSQTPLPTGLPIQGLETATIVVLPTKSPASSSSANVHVVISAVNKELEYVDIQNAGGSPVSLNGWKLVSEVGNQSCILKGILQSKEVMRVWAGRDHPIGLNCGFYHNIWIDDQPDPAVLYNAKGEEVSRYP